MSERAETPLGDNADVAAAREFARWLQDGIAKLGERMGKEHSDTVPLTSAGLTEQLEQGTSPRVREWMEQYRLAHPDTKRLDNKQ